MSKLDSFVKYISPNLASGHLPVDLTFCYEIIVDNLGKYMNMIFSVFCSENIQFIYQTRKGINSMFYTSL